MSDGLVIRWVDEDGIAAELGLMPGDVLLSINNQPIEDVLDYRYRITEEDILLEAMVCGELCSFEIEKECYEDLGVDFESDVVKMQTCCNNCVFCFVTQMPKGMRRSLYIKDDDYRMSFLNGNYITLTNITERDIQRIIDQKLSPLYISVHTTNPELRARMLGRKMPFDVLPLLQRLSDAGIELHCQIVLCPDWNDGAELDNTIRDLVNLHPNDDQHCGVQSIAIVPVGVTKYRDKLPVLRVADQVYASSILAWYRDLDTRLSVTADRRLVFLSDEWYYIAKVSTPSRKHYCGFPQLEDGVGTTRAFLDNLSYLKRRIPEKWEKPAAQFIAVTGMMPLHVIDKFASVLSNVDGITCTALGIINRYFGGSVTIAGLLTGSDIIEQVQQSGLQGDLLIPEVTVRHDGKFLDDVTIEEMSLRLNRKVHIVPIMPSRAWQYLLKNY